MVDSRVASLAALLQQAETFRAAHWGGPSYDKVAEWLLARGVTVRADTGETFAEEEICQHGNLACVECLRLAWGRPEGPSAPPQGEIAALREALATAKGELESLYTHAPDLRPIHNCVLRKIGSAFGAVDFGSCAPEGT